MPQKAAYLKKIKENRTVDIFPMVVEQVSLAGDQIVLLTTVLPAS